MTTKRYRYIGKERDDESGFYYMGARYYCPWLVRWLAPDPINSEWYNMTHGNPGRNKERHFLEMTASGYEYCYANPIRFTDPAGEQAIPQQWTESGAAKIQDAAVAGQNQPAVDATGHAPALKPQGREVMKDGNIISLPDDKSKMRGISSREMEGGNLWHDLNKANPEISIPSNLIYGIANPISRSVQQLTHSITGQRNVWNLDGTQAWSTSAQVGAGGNVSPLDIGTTALFLLMPMGRTADAQQAGVTSGIVTPKLVQSTTGIQVTAHGAEMVAGIQATRGGVLSMDDINATKSLGKAFLQEDGATVYLHEVTQGRFNAVVEGNKGIITTMGNWSQKSINRIAKNYGWKFE